ncbi:MAG: hypothetical protein PSW75_08255 [bacterium]|nr:hypothetical protein [bacterium]
MVVILGLGFLFVGSSDAGIFEPVLSHGPYMLLSRVVQLTGLTEADGIIERNGMVIAFTVYLADLYTITLLLPATLAGYFQGRLETRKSNFIVGYVLLAATWTAITSWTPLLFPVLAFTMALPFLILTYYIGRLFGARLGNWGKKQIPIALAG